MENECIKKYLEYQKWLSGMTLEALKVPKEMFGKDLTYTAFEQQKNINLWNKIRKNGK